MITHTGVHKQLAHSRSLGSEPHDDDHMTIRQIRQHKSRGNTLEGNIYMIVCVLMCIVVYIQLVLEFRSHCHKNVCWIAEISSQKYRLSILKSSSLKRFLAVELCFAYLEVAFEVLK